MEKLLLSSGIGVACLGEMTFNAFVSSRMDYSLVILVAISLVLSQINPTSSFPDEAGPSNVGGSGGGESSSSTPAWAPLAQKVFAMNTRYEDDSLLSDLVELSQLMPKDPEDLEVKRTREQLDELVSLSDFKLSNCTFEFVERIEFLLAFYRLSHTNIARYIAFYILAQQRYCLGQLTKGVEVPLEEWKSTDPTSSNALIRVADELSSYISQMSGRSLETCWSEVYKFMATKVKEALETANQRETKEDNVDFKSIYEDIYTKGCRYVQENLLDSIDALLKYAVLDPRTMSKKMPQRAAILKGACKRILEDDSFFESVRKRYLDELNHASTSS